MPIFTAADYRHIFILRGNDCPILSGNEHVRIIRGAKETGFSVVLHSRFFYFARKPNG
jgi:predicted ABC-type ATPase